MSFKKNAFSYFIWIIFIMCNLVVFSFLSMLYAKVLGGPMPVAALGIAAAFFGLLFLIYFFSGHISKKIYLNRTIEKEKNIKNQLIVEGVLAVCLFAVGIGLRIYLLPTAGESAAYFDVAKVTQDGTALLVPVQSSVYYYLCLLHGMFLIFGNHWIAGIWLQISLQLLASIVLYFVVRKMTGVGVSLITLAYLMFAPSSVHASLAYSPDMLYFLFWSLGMLFVMLYLNTSMKNSEKESVGYKIWMWSTAILVGVLAGFLTYVDISGIILLLPILMLPAVLREKKRTWLWVGRMLLAVIAAVAGFAGSIYLDGILSNANFERILNAWLMTFKPEMPNIVVLLQNSTIEVLILLVVMAFNVFSFYRRRDKDIITVWMLMMFALAALYVMGITTTNMNGRPLLLTLMCVIAAISLRELFQVSPVKAADNVQEDVMQYAIAGGAVVQDAAAMNSVVKVDQNEVNKENQPVVIKKPRFIENPLPLPKKHVKKAMDYAFVPEASQMKFDIEISDADDFDV